MCEVNHMAPAEIVNHYLRILRVMHSEQVCDTLRIHTQFSKGRIDSMIKTMMFQKIVFPPVNGGNYLCINPWEYQDDMLSDSIWVFLSFLKNEKDTVKLISRNQYHGVDFDRDGDFYRVVCIGKNPKLLRQEILSEDNESIMYVFVGDDVSIPTFPVIRETDMYASIRHSKNQRTPTIKYYEPDKEEID